jgi:alpha-beta hydrolase superfamily lysophospholipase
MSDGVTVACHRFAAVGPCRGRIVVIHGIRSHAGWYERSCRDFAAAGYEVIVPDRRGAGANQENRGDCPTFRRLLDDVIEIVEAEKAIGRPVIAMGISWGAKLAISLPYRKPMSVDGIVLVAPGIVPRVGLSLGGKCRIAISRFVRPTKKFPIPLNDPALFTDSVEGQRFIEADPLGLREATARFLFNSVQLDLYVRRAIKAIRCPLLLCSAGQDRIADPVASKAVIARRLEDFTEHTYPEAGHTLEFEPARDAWVARTESWLGNVTAERANLLRKRIRQANGTTEE